MATTKLKKILENKTSYPPSEELWKLIIDTLTKPKKEDDPEFQIKMLQIRAKNEINQYKPNLPEPQVTSFYFQRKLYYLDGHLQVYQIDGGNTLVGNLCGCFKAGEKPNTLDFYLENEKVHTIENVKVQSKKIYDKTYYTDLEQQVFRGLHPQLGLIYKIGTLTEEGKIKLI